MLILKYICVVKVTRL